MEMPATQAEVTYDSDSIHSCLLVYGSWRSKVKGETYSSASWTCSSLSKKSVSCLLFTLSVALASTWEPRLPAYSSCFRKRGGVRARVWKMYDLCGGRVERRKTVVTNTNNYDVQSQLQTCWLCYFYNFTLNIHYLYLGNSTNLDILLVFWLLSFNSVIAHHSFLLVALKSLKHRRMGEGKECISNSASV